MFDMLHFVGPDLADLESVLQDWKHHHPGLGVFVILPEAQQDSVAQVQAVFNRLDTPLMGAIFPALVTDHGFVTEGAWLLGFAQCPAHFLVAELASHGSKRLTQAARAALHDQAARTSQSAELPTLFMVFDAMVPNISSMLDDVHAQLSPHPLYSGVNAGSETFQPMPCLFDNHHLVSNGVLGWVAPSGSHPVARHAYPVSKSLMQATSAEGNRIVTIDGQTAFDVYQRVVQEEYGISLTRYNFYTLAVHFPFGVVTAIDVLVRIPVGLGDDGSLVCVGEIPPSSMLRLLRAPTLETSYCVSDLSTLLPQPRSAENALLSFYCAGRRMHFGGAASRELEMLKQETQCSTLCGALSLGEIDSLEDFNFPRFHNAALVCAWQR